MELAPQDFVAYLGMSSSCQVRIHLCTIFGTFEDPNFLLSVVLKVQNIKANS